jgi:ketopantoate reductase
MGLAITTRVNTWKFLSDPDAALVLARLVREVGELGLACDVALTDESMLPVASMCRGSERAAMESVKALAAGYRSNAPEHRLSTLQDLEAGRPLEIEETLGYAVGKAVQLGLSLPLLANLYPLSGAIDRLRR